MNVQTIDVKQLPVTFNIDLVSGDDLDEVVTIRIDNVLLPWTGVTVTTEIVKTDGTAAPGAVNWTATKGTAGILTLSLTKAQTLSLGLDTYHWWMVLTIGGKERTYFQGKLRLITRRNPA